MLDTLKQWFKFGSPSSGDPVTFPYIHTTPEGDLTIIVRSLNLNRMDKTFPCWLYETKGLMAFGQKELVFILKREPGESEENFPRDPLWLFPNILQLAREGWLVDSGEISWFRTDAKSFCGSYFLLYSFLPHHLRELSSPIPATDRLLCHLLHEDEGESVKAWGGHRMLSQLGQAALYYPFPDWNDRNRKTLSVGADISHSLLIKMPQLRLSQATTYLEGHLDNKNALVTLRVPATALEPLQVALGKMPELPSLAIVTGWEQSATGCFVWRAGQKGVSAIAPPGGGDARVNGNFIILTVEDEVNAIRFHEDGFVVILSPANLERVVQSLRDATPITLTLEGNRFSLYFPD